MTPNPTTTRLMLDLIRRGVRLTTSEGHLTWDAPSGEVDDDLLGRIREQRANLLTLLAESLFQNGQNVQYAATDADAAKGVLVIAPNDEPLPPAQTQRQAGADALILTFGALHRIRHWLDVAGSEPLDDDLVDLVRADLHEAMTLLRQGHVGDGGDMSCPIVKPHGRDPVDDDDLFRGDAA